MKYTWIWCLCNFILIICLMLLIHINIDFQNKAIKEVQDMRIELDAYKNCKSDTIVVNVNNQFDIPKNINIAYKCK